MPELNEVIHQPARLRIMAFLVGLPPDDEADFTLLREHLGLTDGNLGSHLIKLELAELIRVRKTFVARRPCTYLSATTRGRAAFEEHVSALREILRLPGADAEG